MADSKIQFPDASASPFTDAFGQIWIWNDVAWVRRGLEPGVPEAPKDSQQYARVHYYDKPNPLYPGTDPETGNPEPEVIVIGGNWELVQADEWYLGAFEEAPTVDNYGNGLIEGHTYYDLPSHTMMVWDSVEWDAFSGVSEIATLWEYRFDNVDLSAAGTTAPVTLDVSAGDDHGNQPFDAWIKGLITVSVYVDGTRCIERRTITDSYEDIPARPSDEEQQIAVANFAALPVTGEDPPVSYVTLDTNYTWVWDGSAYQRGGAELDRYDFTVDYPNQTITFIQDFTASSTVVFETGTLAASQYIKTSYENATDWAFVNHDCAMGGESPSTGKLVSESAISCYVQAEVEKGLARATQALIGSVFPFAGAIAPVNAIACNNGELLQSQYPLLYAAIGSTWNGWRGVVTQTGYFRVPPQHADGNPIFYGGVGGSNVGEYLANTNKEHSHNAHHSHSGVAQNAGNHRHTLDRYNGSANNSKTTQSATYKSAVDGYTAYSSWMGHAGEHSHNISIDATNIETTVNGSGSAKPDTAIMLMCIWADIQD